MSGIEQPSLLLYLRPEESCDLLQPLNEHQIKGVARHINELPQIVVCGEQSSGKSSVLKAISGIAFPIDRTCGTRLPIELTLYCGPRRPTRLTIRADSNRPECDIQRLDQFTRDFSCGLHDFGHIVSTAKLFIGFSESDRFFQDVICIDVCSPGQPHLVLIDLPGIYTVDGKDSGARNARTAMDLVQQYMKKPSTIILSILPAWEQFKNLLLPKACELADPTGSRTLSVITKPDAVPLAHVKETSVLRSIIQKNVKLHHDWYVLCNTYSSDGKLAEAQRDADEERFFSQGNWQTSCPGRLGVEALRVRIRQMLRDQVNLQLQSVAYRYQKQVSMHRFPLKHFRITHKSSESQRSFLLEVGSKFSRLIKHSLQGHLKDDISINSTEGRNNPMDLRNVIDEVNNRFAQQMRTNGQTAEIVDIEQVLTGRKVSRKTLVDKVEQLLKDQKKIKSLDAFTSLAVKTLFQEQAAPWEAIIKKYEQEITNAACNTIGAILEHICSTTTAIAIGKQIGPTMVTLTTTLHWHLMETQRYFAGNGVVKYIELYHSSYGLDKHIKLFDHNVSKIKNTIHERNLHHNLKPYTYKDGDEIPIKGEYNTILKIVSEAIDSPKPDRRTCLDTTLIMEEYYNDVLPKIITYITKTVVEQSFLTQLASLFDSNVVASLDELALQSIAGNQEPSADQNHSLIGKIGHLECAIQEIKAFEAHSMAMKQQQYSTPRSTSVAPPTSSHPFRDFRHTNSPTVRGTPGKFEIPFQSAQSPRPMSGAPSSIPSSIPAPSPTPSPTSARFSIMDLLSKSVADTMSTSKTTQATAAATTTTTTTRVPFVQQTGASPAYAVPIGTPLSNRPNSPSSSDLESAEAEAAARALSSSRAYRLDRHHVKEW